MRAVIRERYGSFDKIRVAQRSLAEPGDGQVRVAVSAAGLNKADLYALRGQPFFIRFGMGLLRPKNPVVGADFAGRIDALGPGVVDWVVGDPVYGDLSDVGWGAAAERIVVPANAIARAPTRIPLAEAAGAPMAGATAYHAVVEKANVKAGSRVLVVGASGGVGTFALQIARARGARVDAVCSASKAEQATRLGAENVDDYGKAYALPAQATYDAILGVNGFHDIRDYERALNPGGAYVSVGGEGRQVMQAMMHGRRLSRRSGKTFTSLYSKPSAATLRDLARMIDSSDVRPIIEKRYPFERARDAFAHLSRGHASGKILLEP